MELTERESNLEGHLRRQVGTLGGLVIKLGYDGWTDDIVVLPRGRVGFLELKKRGEEPEPHQAIRMEQLADRGAYVGWANTRSGIDRFLSGLRKLHAI